MSTFVVFTGACKLKDGTKINREDLIKTAEAFGFEVRHEVTWLTDLVVASRLDTVKAKAAFAMGSKKLKVICYDDFVNALGTDTYLSNVSKLCLK